MTKAKNTAEVLPELADPIVEHPAQSSNAMPITDADLVQFATRIPKGLLKSMKICCVREEMSVILFMQGAIQAHLERYLDAAGTGAH